MKQTYLKYTCSACALSLLHIWFHWACLMRASCALHVCFIVQTGYYSSSLRSAPLLQNGFGNLSISFFFTSLQVYDKISFFFKKHLSSS